jgi:hypothetical protein
MADSTTRNAVYDLVDATWSDATTIFAEQDADRVNWLALVRRWQDGQLDGLQPPFVVVLWGREVPAGPESGICNAAVEQVVTCVLVAELSASGSEATENWLRTRAESLRSAFWSFRGVFQVIHQPIIDESPMSPAQRAMTAANLPFASITVESVILFGEAAD